MNRTRTPGRTAGLLLCLAYLVGSPSGFCPAAMAAGEGWLSKVLITNDNGIEDPKIVALARAFAGVGIETWVVASDRDRSGTGSFSRLMSERPAAVNLVRHDFGEGVNAFALDGFPADCVLFAIRGPLRDGLPDLVVSGINGGANLGPDWFGSGTIGAARAAAFGSIRAIAVSGLDDDDQEAVRAHVDWVVRLARSTWVENLEAGQYLTVAMPRHSPEEIRGIRVARRAGIDPQGLPIFRLDQERSTSTEQARTTWRLEPGRGTGALIEEDISAWAENYIVVTPMTVDEIDQHSIERLRVEPAQLPAYRSVDSGR